jgi:hypothetical protein
LGIYEKNGFLDFGLLDFWTFGILKPGIYDPIKFRRGHAVNSYVK